MIRSLSALALTGLTASPAWAHHEPSQMTGQLGLVIGLVSIVTIASMIAITRRNSAAPAPIRTETPR